MAVPQFATSAELDVFIGTDYAVPVDADRILQRASEIVAFSTIGLYSGYWHTVTVDDPHDTFTEGLRDATCAQVEFWLEVGEEHDIVGLTGAVTSGRLFLSKLPQQLAPRARRFLLGAGLLHARAGVR
jgi:hypothetical protein